MSRQFAKNTIFFELGGNALTYSLNYDRILFIRNNISLGARIGASVLPTSWNEVHYIQWVIPSEFNILYGKNHRLESGVGINYGHGVNNISLRVPGYDQVIYTSIISETLFLTLRIVSYRFQRRQGGFFLRIGTFSTVQIYELNEDIRSLIKDPDHLHGDPVNSNLHRGGEPRAYTRYFMFNVSLGYTFKSKPVK